MSNNYDSFGDDDGDTSSILDGYESDDVIRDNPDLLSRRPNEFEYNPSSPSDVDPEHWTDVFVSSVGVDVHFSIDTATKASWEQAIGDIKEVRGRLAELVSSRLDSDDIKHDASGDVNVSFENLFDLVFGFESGEFGRVFARELGLDHKLYLKFLGTLFLQMSYKESPSQLFADDSELKSSLFIEKREYITIWQDIANKGRITASSYVNNTRREEYLWMKCERACNIFLRDVGISGSNRLKIHSLDDDKIWQEQSGRNTVDTYDLLNTTHNRDNRKGLISHTNVSLPLLLPLYFRFQRKGETAVDCFIHIYQGMFQGPSLIRDVPDLNGNKNHSDRGYTNHQTVFKFLIPGGASLTNTIKRSFPNPYIWGMKTSDDDKRTKLDEKGCPALFFEGNHSYWKESLCPCLSNWDKKY